MRLVHASFTDTVLVDATLGALVNYTTALCSGDYLGALPIVKNKRPNQD